MNDRRRVLIIDDSAVARQALTNIFSQNEDLEVVGTAPDAMIGLRKIESLQPDVITLDVEMPGMDGLTFLEKLMKSNPMPVVMVSAHTESGSASALRSLELGAVDVVEKPRVGVRDGLNQLADLIVEKVKAASYAKVDTPAIRFFQKGPVKAVPISQVERTKISELSDQHVIAIGASTGGPQALSNIFKALPQEMPPILVVQHITPSFTESFCNSLDLDSQLTVKIGTEGARLQRNHAYLAPGDQHMLLRRSGGNLTLKISNHDRVNRHRPSVDELFTSVAETVGQCATGVLLTGMGVDGAAGLAKMRENGAWTLAQDESSSVVFGMPRAAIERGAADQVVNLDNIASSLVGHFIVQSNK
jgi:two-component system chemotaxis response regulator CheB